MDGVSETTKSSDGQQVAGERPEEELINTSSDSNWSPSPEVSNGSNFTLDLRKTCSCFTNRVPIVLPSFSSELLRIVYSGTSLIEGKEGIMRPRLLCLNEETDLGETEEAPEISNTDTPPTTV
jgi:hypothetical protein